MSRECEDPNKASDNETAAESLLHPTHRVYFRAGLIACREYMARFVESESPTIAASIRANWWPSLGPDLGPRGVRRCAASTDHLAATTRCDD